MNCIEQQTEQVSASIPDFSPQILNKRVKLTLKIKGDEVPIVQLTIVDALYSN